ncbi:GPP34 family phosphoprotein [Streptomyces sp. NBC_00083]|uniref:GOLPH3/VPS74 family protein n=1 Tax=Streptomyces sp. NBC_00083 TaxID=2975647 RepID=UPI0022577309|nr:GPP34 family phosphoprotein [Streptomyces sp. NBC_00083]MCX5386394.1 GPP34 family phosphoprotein [Streptomyces sp. NBC_00083]
MTLSLYGRTYLTAYDTDSGALYDRTRAGFLLRVAVLADLARAGRVADRAGEVAVVDGGATGDPVLDLVLPRLGAHRRTWKAWLRTDRKETLAAVEGRLAALGVITVRERPAAFPRPARRAVSVCDAAEVRALQGALAAVLRGAGPAGPDEAVLVALAAAGGAHHVVSRADAKARRDRVEELTGHLDAVAPALGRAVRGLGTTLVAAQGGMGGG